MFSQYIAIVVFLVVVIVSALTLNAFGKDEESEVAKLKKENAKLKEDEKKRLETNYLCIDNFSRLSAINAEKNKTIEKQKAEIMSLRKDLIESNALVLQYQHILLKKDDEI